MLTNRLKFYTSDKWIQLKRHCIERATRDDGFVYDELNGERIILKGDIICHHVVELDDDNVDDFSISLNPDNVKVVSFRHHNEIHQRFGYQIQKKVIWIYGAPFSPSIDKFISSHMTERDIICDVSRIRKACTNVLTPNRNSDIIVYILRDRLLDAIATRTGQWETAYIVTVRLDERMAIKLGAYPLEISDSMEDCLHNMPSYVSPTVIYDYFTPPIG